MVLTLQILLVITSLLIVLLVIALVVVPAFAWRYFATKRMPT